MELRTTLSISGRELRTPVWIIGPDVIESEAFTLDLARELRQIAERRALSLVFKASYEKANRTSAASFRGPGLAAGLRTLERVREETGLLVTSDVHDEADVAAAANVLDVIQIPAFLSRQNRLLERVAATGRTPNLKKGQFLSPWDIPHRVEVLRSAGAADVWITERGVSFGYQRLVNDFRVVPLTHEARAVSIFDATHSVQTPGGAGHRSGGEREFIPTLARAAVAAGVDGLFFEVHPQPEKALCDGPNSVPLEHLESLLDQLEPLAQLVRRLPSTPIEGLGPHS
ncbi:MAG: 3-deoxy-8-phosphooctulonate synthase [Planctomycetota bacterium]